MRTCVPPACDVDVPGFPKCPLRLDCAKQNKNPDPTRGDKVYSFLFRLSKVHKLSDMLNCERGETDALETRHAFLHIHTGYAVHLSVICGFAN